MNKNRDKVPQTKEKDFDVVQPSVGFTDMSDEMQELAYEICREAYSKYYYFILFLICWGITYRNAA